MLVSNFARSEGQIFPMIPLVILISVFFSGIILPIEKLPDFIEPARFITPMYYANTSIQGLIDASSDVNPASGWIGLVVYGVVLLGVATFTLRES